MKKFIVLSIILLMLAGFAITSSAMVVTLFADQTIEVGTLNVEVIGDNLVVTYAITDTEWELGETHLYVGTIAPTKSAPGRFPYGPEDVVEEGKYEIALDGFTGTLFIAAQAEIGKIDPDTGEPVLDFITGLQIEETAWAIGEGSICIPPCKNWAMYFTFEVVAP